MITIEQKLENFINALRSHDWFYNYSDDHSVWCRGRDERDSLMATAKSMVRTFQANAEEVASLWNEHAPSRFRVDAKMFEVSAPKPQRVFIKPLKHPRMGDVVTLKNEIGCSASEANFRLKFGVEPSDLERELAEDNGGRFILHFPSHPEIWEWRHDIA